MPTLRATVVTTPGIEPVTTAELAGLGIDCRPAGRGLLSVRVPPRQLYLALLALRTAERVQVDLARFPAGSFSELGRGLEAVPWEQVLPRGEAPEVHAAANRSRLYHTGAIVERVSGHIGGTLPPSGAQRILVRIERDVATVSADAGGEPLHRRGWRLEGARAPLRETLAAAMLLATGWTGEVPLVDPMGGSGTIAIEAALLARRSPPGLGRAMAVQRWPSFEPGTWGAARAAATACMTSRSPAPILVSDRDAGAMRAARANADRAGVTADVEFAEQALSALAPPSPFTWVVTNPPYGDRVGGGRDLRDLYARLGAICRERLRQGRVVLLVADQALASSTRLPLQEILRTRNGGIPVRLLATPSR
ncbi:MAG TPA: methyltransferase [Acidimicrobiales bacterium]